MQIKIVVETVLKGYNSVSLTPPCLIFLPGTLLPRLPSEPGMTLLTIKIEKIGLKDAGQCIDPYITVSVKGSCCVSCVGEAIKSSFIPLTLLIYSRLPAGLAVIA